MCQERGPRLWAKWPTSQWPVTEAATRMAMPHTTHGRPPTRPTRIFEALSSAPRRRIVACLSKTDMTAGEIAQRFAYMDEPAGHLQALVDPGERPG
jgi:hypothetical protein